MPDIAPIGNQKSQARVLDTTNLDSWTTPPLSLGRKALAAVSGFTAGGAIGAAASLAIAAAVLSNPIGWAVGGALLGALVLGIGAYLIIRATTPENQRSELDSWFFKGAAVGGAIGAASTGAGVFFVLSVAIATGAAVGAVFATVGLWSYWGDVQHREHRLKNQGSGPTFM